MGLDAGQSLAASTFGTSLAVIAGAGSGKTKTMEMRILDAFLTRETDETLPDGSVYRAHPALVDGIDQVLAITFTEAAAAELKARVKSTLRASSDKHIHDQALFVDDAWISTIHGMCSRLLKENAYVLGVDPLFKVAPESVRETLLDDAIEEAIAQSGEVGAQLLEEFGVDGEFSKGVPGFIKDMISAAVKSPMLFDSFVVPQTASPRKALEYLLDALDDDPKEDLAKAKEDNPSNLEDVKNYNASGMDFKKGSPDAAAIQTAIKQVLRQDEVSADDALAVCEMFTLGGTPKEFQFIPPMSHAWASPWAASRSYHWRGAIVACVSSIMLAKRAQDLEELIALARKSYEIFCAKKDELAVLDNDDLLLRAYAALQNPDIAAAYKDRFRVVIVDEFQDTNRLQLDIIKNFTGQNDERLCVVGDRMQSIYRFQGADVSVCNEHLATSAKEQLELDSNYRSHADIISFVDRAFRDMDCEYLQLQAMRNEALVSGYAGYDEAAEGPRVTVVETQFANKDDSAARALSAAYIAQRFQAMHDGNPGADGAEGRSYGDMVILLNSMNHSDVYADALRERGIPCAIVKGSILKRSVESRVVRALLDVLANPQNTEALFTLLTSEIFGLSDEDLAQLYDAERSTLATAFTDAALELVRGKSADAAGDAGAAGDADAADAKQAPTRKESAVRVVAQALAQLGSKPVSSIVEEVLVSSGALLRMEGGDAAGSASADDAAADDAAAEGARVRGLAAAGNYLKLVRLVRDLEDQGSFGPAQLAVSLNAQLENDSQSPGSLSTAENGFVRIMTIHSSKGLAFPIVAMGEASASTRSSALTVETCMGKTYLTLMGGESFRGSSVVDQCRKAADVAKALGLDLEPMDAATFTAQMESAREMADAAAFLGLLQSFHSSQEEAELERKIYVALTRAQEALVVTMVNEVPADEVRKAQSTKDAPKSKQDYNINVNGLDGKLSGSFEQMHMHRQELREQGWDYLSSTPMWTKAFARSGVLPPAYRGQPDAPENADGFDLSVYEQQKAVADTQAEAPFLVFADSPVVDRPHYRYSPSLASGVMSASSIKAALQGDKTYYQAPAHKAIADTDGTEEEESLFDELAPRADATARGLAFHALCEWSTRHGMQAPPAERIEAICRFNGLGDADTADIRKMLARWFDHAICAEMASRAQLVPEEQFFVELGQPQDATDFTADQPVRLTGFIDLLGYDTKAAGPAFAVDYKTGTSLTTPQARHAAYEVQALVYAYAILLQGYESVNLRFVFVEQDMDGQLPVEEFPAAGEAYTSADEVRALILAKLAQVELVDDLGD